MLRRLIVVMLALAALPAVWAARGTTSPASANAIFNSSFAAPANSGPFTVAFWFKSGNLTQAQTYLVEGGQSNSQWAVIYGYAPGANRVLPVG
jgi:hypothetical protein